MYYWRQKGSWWVWEYVRERGRRAVGHTMEEWSCGDLMRQTKDSESIEST